MAENRIHRILIVAALLDIEQLLFHVVKPFQALREERRMKPGKVQAHNSGCPLHDARIKILSTHRLCPLAVDGPGPQ